MEIGKGSVPIGNGFVNCNRPIKGKNAGIVICGLVSGYRPSI